MVDFPCRRGRQRWRCWARVRRSILLGWFVGGCAGNCETVLTNFEPNQKPWTNIVRLDQWIKYQKETLLVTAIHALQPPIDLSRAAVSVLRILLVPRQNEVVPGKYFMICTAWVDAQLDVIELGGQWETAMRQFPRISWQHEWVPSSSMRIDVERAVLHGYGTKLTAGRFQCHNRWRNIVKPLGSFPGNIRDIGCAFY